VTAPLLIEAEVDEREHRAVTTGAEQFAEALTAASGADWAIQLRFFDPGGAGGGGAVSILSFLREAEGEEPLAQTEARWRARLGELRQCGGRILICTVFRHLADRHAPRAERILQRIRRLNRMAAELSHDLGVTVVDLDRAFAHIGGRVLECDYQLEGRLAAEVAGHTLAWSLLSLGLDEAIAPEVQERAKAFHGGLNQINTLVSRRLSKV
jgi:hypothetical protein